jgi:Fe-S-cluster containining protein
MKDNLCEDCDACCRVLRIDKKFLSWRDTDKPAGELCQQFDRNRCKIYATRPKPCRDFKCLWLALKGTELDNPNWIPNKIGCVVTFVENNGQHQIIIKELDKNSLDFKNLTKEQETYLKAIFYLRENGQTNGSNCVVFIQPFGSTSQYPLGYNERKINGI